MIAVMLQRLLEGDSFHLIIINNRTGTDRVHPLLQRTVIGVDLKLQLVLLHQFIAESGHLSKFPGRINVQQWKRHRSRRKGFTGQV